MATTNFFFFSQCLLPFFFSFLFRHHHPPSPSLRSTFAKTQLARQAGAVINKCTISNQEQSRRPSTDQHIPHDFSSATLSWYTAASSLVKKNMTDFVSENYGFCEGQRVDLVLSQLSLIL